MQRFDIYYEVEGDLHPPIFNSAVLLDSNNQSLSENVEGFIQQDKVLFYIPDHIDLHSAQFIPTFNTLNVERILLEGSTFIKNETSIPHGNYQLNTLEFQGLYGKNLNYFLMVLHRFRVNLWGTDPLSEIPIGQLTTNMQNDYIYLEFNHEQDRNQDIIPLLEQSNANLSFSEILDWGNIHGGTPNTLFRVKVHFPSPGEYTLNIPQGLFRDFMGGLNFNRPTMNLLYDPNLQGDLTITVHHENPATQSGSEEIHRFSNQNAQLLHVYSNQVLDNPGQIQDQLNSQNSGMAFTNLTDIGSSHGITLGKLFRLDYALSSEGDYTISLAADSIENGNKTNINSSDIFITLDQTAPQMPMVNYVTGGPFGLDISMDNLNDPPYGFSDLTVFLYYESATVPETLPPPMGYGNYIILGNLTSDYLLFESSFSELYDHYVAVGVFDRAGNQSMSSTIHYKSKEVFYVDDDNIAGPWNGTITEPYSNIHQAVDMAHKQNLSDGIIGNVIQIRVAQGTYYPYAYSASNDSGPLVERFIHLYADIELIGSYNSSFTTRDPLSTPSVIEGFDGVGYADHLISNYSEYYGSGSLANGAVFPLNDSQAPNENTLLDGFVLQNGFIDDSSEGGAAIYTNYPFIIRNSRFFNNRTQDLLARMGGALLYFNAPSTFPMEIQDCHFMGNFAHNSGGAIYSDGYIYVSNSIFESNDTNSKGAALYITGFGYSMISDSTFIANNAENHGGAVALETGDLTIIRSDFGIFGDPASGNRTEFDGGGALSAQGGGILTVGTWAGPGSYVDGCNFYYNHSVDGGAIYQQGGELYLYDSTARYNYSLDHGGAIYLSGVYGEIKGQQYTNNFADSMDELGTDDPADAIGDGGAFYFTANSNMLIGEWINISSNQAQNGGALYSESSSLNILHDSAFGFNQAMIHGGALYITGSASTIETTMDGVDFSENFAGGDGGALYRTQDIQPMAITNSMFFCNLAQGNGGAIFNGDNDGDMAILQSFFIGNGNSATDKTDDGGAIFINDVSLPDPTNVYVVNSLFIYNVSHIAKDITTESETSYFMGINNIHHSTFTPSVELFKSPATAMAPTIELWNSTVYNHNASVYSMGYPTYEVHTVTEEPIMIGGKPSVTKDTSLLMPANFSPTINMGYFDTVNFLNSLGMGLPELLYDFNGDPRDQHGLMDIGPFEYQGGDMSAPQMPLGMDIIVTEIPGITMDVQWLAADDDLYSHLPGSAMGQLEYQIVHSNTPITNLSEAWAADIIWPYMIPSDYFAPWEFLVSFDISTEPFASQLTSSGDHYIAVMVRDMEGKENLYNTNFYTQP